MGSSQSPRSKLPAKLPRSKTDDLGSLAENWVARWLTGQGWQIVVQRWRCPQGELDLVALTPERTLAFVEVKARSRGNWDAGGLLAITPAKQEKLAYAAQSFLAAQPQWADYPCRFDVAIVQCRPRPQPQPQPQPPEPAELVQVIQVGQPQGCGAYWLTLQEYISGAFEGS